MQEKTKNSCHVVFFQIKDPQAKLIKIIQTAYDHFSKNEPLLISVQDDIALKYIDDLLWKHPPDSFLPHIAAEDEVSDLIVLTKKEKNLNKAKHLFNLRAEDPYIDNLIKIIYDFDDFTSAAKTVLAKKRFNYYRSLGFSIESR